MVEVRKVSNGWIVKTSASERVYTDANEMLRAVYQSCCEWKVGDQIVIERKA